MEAALRDVEAGIVSFAGQIVTGKKVLPSHWPTDKTRRYY
jgi:hypothetical protein